MKLGLQSHHPLSHQAKSFQTIFTYFRFHIFPQCPVNSLVFLTCFLWYLSPPPHFQCHCIIIVCYLYCCHCYFTHVPPTIHISNLLFSLLLKYYPNYVIHLLQNNFYLSKSHFDSQSSFISSASLNNAFGCRHQKIPKWLIQMLCHICISPEVRGCWFWYIGTIKALDSLSVFVHYHP